MGSVNVRDGRLYLDFRYRSVRCREHTKLNDSPANRKALAALLARIELEIQRGTFDYGKHFPGSPKVEHFRQIEQLVQQKTVGGKMLFEVFADLWLKEKRAEWRLSHIETIEGILRCHLVPYYRGNPIGVISKGDIMALRGLLCQADAETGKQLSASRVNHIMTALRMILNEAAERFGYESPWRNIKALPMPRADIQPFTLKEVRLIIDNVRADFRSYYLVRFFTGMRTGEIDGLTWENVDFGSRQIHIRQALVRGQIEKTKTASSYRTLAMSQVVYDGLYEQWKRSDEKNRFVFTARNGQPLNHRNVTRRVWYPLLEYLGLGKRNPYQSRHTAATLWLAAGENPEWIARQLGHANTSMLFRVYSRYIPNLIRQDGSAFEQLLDQELCEEVD